MLIYSTALVCNMRGIVPRQAVWLVNMSKEEEDGLNCRRMELCNALKSNITISSLMSQRNWEIKTERHYSWVRRLNIAAMVEG